MKIAIILGGSLSQKWVISSERHCKKSTWCSAKEDAGVLDKVPIKRLVSFDDGVENGIFPVVAFTDGVEFCSENKETSASSGEGYDSVVVGVNDGLAGSRI